MVKMLEKIRELNELSGNLHKLTFEILEYFERRKFSEVKSLVDELLGRNAEDPMIKNRKSHLPCELQNEFANQIASLNLSVCKIPTKELLILYSKKYPNDYSVNSFGMKMMKSLFSIQTKCNCFSANGSHNIRYWTISPFTQEQISITKEKGQP